MRCWWSVIALIGCGSPPPSQSPQPVAPAPTQCALLGSATTAPSPPGTTWQTLLAPGTGGFTFGTHDRLVVAGGTGAQILSIDAATGAPCAMLVDKGAPIAPPIDPYTSRSGIAHGLLVGGAKFSIGAVDVWTGKLRWQHDVAGAAKDDEYALRDSLHVIESTTNVVIGFHVRQRVGDSWQVEEIVAALDPATGVERWRVTAVAHPVGAPVQQDGTLRLATDGARVYARSTGKLVALDAATGAPLWTTTWTATPTTPGPWTYARLGPLVAAGGGHVAIAFKDRIQLLDAPTGRTLRELPVAGYASELVVHRGGVYAALEVEAGTASVVAIDAATGHVRWTYAASYAVRRLRVDDGTLLAGADPVPASGGDRASAGSDRTSSPAKDNRAPSPAGGDRVPSSAGAPSPADRVASPPAGERVPSAGGDRVPSSPQNERVPPSPGGDLVPSSGGVPRAGGDRVPSLPSAGGVQSSSGGDRVSSPGGDRMYILDGNGRVWGLDLATGAPRSGVSAGAWDFVVAHTTAGPRIVVPVGGLTAYDPAAHAKPATLDPFLRWAVDPTPIGCQPRALEWLDGEDRVVWQRPLPARVRGMSLGPCGELEMMYYRRSPRASGLLYAFGVVDTGTALVEADRTGVLALRKTDGAILLDADAPSAELRDSLFFDDGTFELDGLPACKGKARHAEVFARCGGHLVYFNRTTALVIAADTLKVVARGTYARNATGTYVGRAERSGAAIPLGSFTLKLEGITYMH